MSMGSRKLWSAIMQNCTFFEIPRYAIYFSLFSRRVKAFLKRILALYHISFNTASHGLPVLLTKIDITVSKLRKDCRDGGLLSGIWTRRTSLKSVSLEQRDCTVHSWLSSRLHVWVWAEAPPALQLPLRKQKSNQMGVKLR